MTTARICFAAVGLFLSLYSLQVEIKAEHDKNYRAFCDINEHISCTKVFMSPYGRGFGIIGQVFGKNSIINLPNPVFGCIFYSLMILMCYYRGSYIGARLLVNLSVISCLTSVYLGFILYKLQDTCVVCISTYFVNFSLLYLNFKYYNQFGLSIQDKTKKE